MREKEKGVFQTRFLSLAARMEYSGQLGSQVFVMVSLTSEVSSLAPSENLARADAAKGYTPELKFRRPFSKWYSLNIGGRPFNFSSAAMPGSSPAPRQGAAVLGTALCSAGLRPPETAFFYF